jgi:cathepsin B
MLLVLAAAAHPIQDSIYQQVLTHEHRTWTPVHPSKNPLRHYSAPEIAALCGTQVGDAIAKPTPLGSATSGGLPRSFDARQHFGKCSHQIRDQKHCGSCWAFSSAETLSDNLCVLSNGTVDVVLSPQSLISCDSLDNGCKGGSMPMAWTWIGEEGILTDTCAPYTSGGGNRGVCDNSTCASSRERPRFYTCPEGYEGQVWDTAVDMKKAILQYGAVAVGFTVYEDFMHYSSGVYRHITGKVAGGHGVKAIGWGEDETGLYWVVANSWNTGWGEHGYFRIYDWSVDADSAFGRQGGYSCGKKNEKPHGPDVPGCGDADAKLCPAVTDLLCHTLHTICKKSCGCCAKTGAPEYCGPMSVFV